MCLFFRDYCVPVVILSISLIVVLRILSKAAAICGSNLQMMMNVHYIPWEMKIIFPSVEKENGP